MYTRVHIGGRYEYACVRLGRRYEYSGMDARIASPVSAHGIQRIPQCACRQESVYVWMRGGMYLCMRVCVSSCRMAYAHGAFGRYPGASIGLSAHIRSHGIMHRAPGINGFLDLAFVCSFFVCLFNCVTVCFLFAWCLGLCVCAYVRSCECTIAQGEKRKKRKEEKAHSEKGSKASLWDCTILFLRMCMLMPWCLGAWVPWCIHVTSPLYR
jgi:hypothetical protein